MTPKPASTRLRLAIPFCPRLVSCLAGIVLPLIALLALSSLIQGCESAESFAAETGVEPSDGGDSNNGSDNGGNDPDNGGGGTGGGTDYEYRNLAVSPPSAVHTSAGNFTIFEVAQQAGYTYSWTLSDPTWGSVAPSTGTRVTYSTRTIPGSGTQVQTLTVTGIRSGSNVRYRGTATVTHQAP